MQSTPQAPANQTQDASQAVPATASAPDSHHQLFDYQHMEWELDEPPSPQVYLPTQLFHLYTISGHLFIGVWSEHYEIAALASPSHMHIVGWAPVANPHPAQ